MIFFLLFLKETWNYASYWLQIKHTQIFIISVYLGNPLYAVRVFKRQNATCHLDYNKNVTYLQVMLLQPWNSKVHRIQIVCNSNKNKQKHTKENTTKQIVIMCFCTPPSDKQDVTFYGHILSRSYFQIKPRK